MLDDHEKSKAEKYVLTTDVVNGILEGMGLKSHITELQRQGNFESDRKKPRALMLSLSTEHEARLVLAKASDRRHDLMDKGTFVLLALSKGDSRNENLCLKKRRQLLERNVLREKLKIRNLELYNDGLKVALEDPVNVKRLGFLNVLQIIA